MAKTTQLFGSYYVADGPDAVREIHVLVDEYDARTRGKPHGAIRRFRFLDVKSQLPVEYVRDQRGFKPIGQPGPIWPLVNDDDADMVEMLIQVD